MVKTFLFDFEVFKGNSGGPVYANYIGRRYGGIFYIDKTIQFLAGLVTSESVFTIHNNKDPYFKSVESKRLAIGHVLHASFIKEAIEMLPEK